MSAHDAEGPELDHSANARSGRKKLVVVADDDDSMRELFALALATEGYTIISVSSGRTLVDQVRRVLADGEHGGIVDLIISDIHMPEMDGMRALEQVRALDARIPFIFVTAFSDPATRNAVSAYQAEVIDKPVQLQQLRAVVRTRLGM
jgi:CheY-like chemotaxis protein